MDYATAYDIGERKRGSGINEDSVAVLTFEDGHREGRITGEERPAEGSADNGSAGGVPLGPNRRAGVFVLSDGAGGTEAGDVASYIVTTTVAEELSDVIFRAAKSRPDTFGVELPVDVLPAYPSPETIRAAIESAIVEAHRQVLEFAVAEGLEDPALATLVVGVYLDGSLHCGWVGDSRAYVVNEVREEISLLTKDHSLVEQMADAGEIDEVEEHVHPDGNQIVRAVGGSKYENPASSDLDPADLGHLGEIDTHTVPLFAEDIVLFTSDGLIDAQADYIELYQRYEQSGKDEALGREILDLVVTDDEIKRTVLTAGREDLSGAADDLVTLANDRGGKDNISVILFTDFDLPRTPSPDDSAIPIRARDPANSVEDWETVITGALDVRGFEPASTGSD